MNEHEKRFISSHKAILQVAVAAWEDSPNDMAILVSGYGRTGSYLDARITFKPDNNRVMFQCRVGAGTWKGANLTLT